MSNVSKHKRNVLVIISICVAIVLLITTLYQYKMTPVKREMEQFLKKEYCEEFVVKRVDYGWKYLGGPPVYIGIANPKADRSLEFEIRGDPYEKNFRQYLSFAESYRYELWGKQKAKK